MPQLAVAVDLPTGRSSRYFMGTRDGVRFFLWSVWTATRTLSRERGLSRDIVQWPLCPQDISCTRRYLNEAGTALGLGMPPNLSSHNADQVVFQASC